MKPDVKPEVNLNAHWPKRRLEFVYGKHLIREQRAREVRRFIELLSINRTHPGFSTWPKETEAAVSKLKPGILTIDGKSFDPTFQTYDGGSFALNYRWEDSSSLFGVPGNPFDLKQKNGELWIVEGDLPTNSLREYKDHKRRIANGQSSTFYSRVMETHSPETRLARELVNQAVITYLEKNDNLPIEIINSFSFDKEEFEAAKLGRKQLIFEISGSATLAITSINYFLARFKRSIKSDEKISRREFIALGSLFALSLVNGLRVGAGFIPMVREAISRSDLLDKDDLTDWYYGWGRPLSSYLTGNFDMPFGLINDVKILELRNAMTATKALEAPEIIEVDKVPEGVAVDVMGTAHKWGRKADDKQIRDAIVHDALTEIMLTLKEASTTELRRADIRAEVVEEMARFFGGMAVWKVKEAPKVYTPFAIADQIPLLGDLVSPTISRITHQVAEEIKL